MLQMVEELVDAYPDAVVICTTRDPKSWWKSFEPVSKQFLLMQFLRVLFQTVPTLRYIGVWMDEMRHRWELCEDILRSFANQSRAIMNWGTADVNGAGILKCTRPSSRA